MSKCPPRIEDLEIWRFARRLAREVYAVTESGGFGRDWALCEAARRVVLQLMSAVAELAVPGPAQARDDRVLAARAALAALASHLYVALDQGYVTPDELYLLRQTTVMVQGMLIGLEQRLEAAA